MTDKSSSHFKEVAASTEDDKSQVIPDGETWEIYEFEGSALFDPNCHVRLVWDYGGGGEELLYFTAGNIKTIINKQFTGDGVKKLSIVLINNSGSACVLGGCYNAYKL